MFRNAASTKLLLALIALLVTAPLAFCQSDEASKKELRVFDPSLIDKSIDPCDNFYQYSCGNWFKQNPLPADQVAYGRFTELYELNRLHLRDLLEQAATPSDTRTPNEQKIGDEYATCMDTAAIDKAGISPLKPELDRIDGLKSTAGLPALLGHLHSIGVSAFFRMNSDPDYSNANNKISSSTASGLGLADSDY